MEAIEDSQKIPYKVTNSFYEINKDTMWSCKDTVRGLPYRQNRVSKFQDEPLSTKNHNFNE
ncbi:MAG: hypothetical protein J1F11_10250 [Oscillospiraceae bacterium]|nr:hypothetical protein [Oscillospiraceae bacterium]